jgi:hypothetical protein
MSGSVKLVTYAVALGLSDEVLRVAAAHRGRRGPAGQFRGLEQGFAFSLASNSPVLNDAAWNRLGDVPLIHASDPRYSAGAAGGFLGGFGGGGGGGAGGGGGGGGAW